VVLVKSRGSTPLVPKATIVHNLQPAVLITSTYFIIRIKATLPPNEKNVSIDYSIIVSIGITEIQLFFFLSQGSLISDVISSGFDDQSLVLEGNMEFSPYHPDETSSGANTDSYV
jgi:hypothetical protein